MKQDGWAERSQEKSHIGGQKMGKEQIREYALGIGADIVGFASIEDYENKGAVAADAVLPSAKSMVVCGYREINGAVDSLNDRSMMASRMAEMELNLSCLANPRRSTSNPFACNAFAYRITLGSRSACLHTI